MDLGASIDKVIASISYTLPSLLENLDLASASTALSGTGNSLDNVLTGNTFGNSLNGKAGNDTLTGMGGNDTLDGDTGIDIATYAGNRSDLTIAQSCTGFTVTDTTNAEGADTLANIERLTFSNTKIAVDINGNAGTTAKILGAVFGTASLTNKVYVGIGLSYLDGGMTYSDLMALALHAAGATTSNAEVTLLWTNLFDVAPTAAEAAPFIALLDNNSLTASALGVLAADYSVNTSHIGLTGLSRTGLEYSTG